MSRTLCVLAILAGISTLGACGRGHDLDDAALRAADADSAEWLSYGRTYTEQRHSPLTQVDEQSVSRPGLAGSVDLQRNWGITVPGIVDTARAETRSESSHVGFNDRYTPGDRVSADSVHGMGAEQVLSLPPKGRQ